MTRSLAAALALPFVLAGALAAQEEEDDKDWSLESELGASIFFGASEQSSVLFRNKFAKTQDHFEFSTNLGFDYGEAQPSPEEAAQVNQRAWNASMELDYNLGRWAPFIYGTAEGSLQRAIDLRTAGGGGIKYHIIQGERTTFDVLAAVQGERTDPREEPGTTEEIVTLARLNTGATFEQKFGEDRAVFSQSLAYRPALGDSEDYTLDSETALTFNFNTMFSFKASLVNRYDNLAVSRGAFANNDGRVFFSVIATH